MRGVLEAGCVKDEHHVLLSMVPSNWTEMTVTCKSLMGCWREGFLANCQVLHVYGLKFDANYSRPTLTPADLLQIIYALLDLLVLSTISLCSLLLCDFINPFCVSHMAHLRPTVASRTSVSCTLCNLVDPDLSGGDVSWSRTQSCAAAQTRTSPALCS